MHVVVLVIARGTKLDDVRQTVGLLHMAETPIIGYVFDRSRPPSRAVSGGGTRVGWQDPDTAGRMRILQLHTRYRQAGGEDHVVIAEAELLRSAGHEVEQMVADNPISTMAAAAAMLKSPWNRRPEKPSRVPWLASNRRSPTCTTRGSRCRRLSWMGSGHRECRQ